MELRKKIQLKMYATYYLGYYPLYGKSKYVYKSQEFFIALNIVAGFFLTNLGVLTRHKRFVEMCETTIWILGQWNRPSTLHYIAKVNFSKNSQDISSKDFPPKNQASDWLTYLVFQS